MSLSVTIKANPLGDLFGLNKVSATPPGESRWFALLDPVVNWVCGADRSGAIEALDVLQSVEAKYHGKDGTVLGNSATLQAYLKLKSLVIDDYRRNFSERPSREHLEFSISGLDAGRSVNFKVPANDVSDVVLDQIAKQLSLTCAPHAKQAVENLLNAHTPTEQLCAYADLATYALPSPNSVLTWQIPNEGTPVFRLGALDIPYCTPTTGAAAPVSLGDKTTASVLCSMHYDGKCVITGFQGKSTAEMITSPRELFQQAPQLLDALKLLSLHGYEAEFLHAVESFSRGMCDGNGDADLFAQRCAGNAVQLVNSLKRLENPAQTSLMHIAPWMFA